MTFLPSIYGGYGFGYFPPILGTTVVPTPNADKAPSATPKPVERQNLGIIWGAGTGAFPGYAKAPAGTWATYQFMSRNPTLALVYAVATNPIIAGQRNVKILDDDGTYRQRTRPPVAGDGVISTPEDQYADALEATFRPRWSYLMNACSESLRYGHWLMEVIWDRRNGLTAIAEFKSFRPGQVQMLRDKYDAFAGVRLHDRDLDPRYVFNVVNEPHIDPLFGFSRHENCREEWWEKIQAKLKGMELDQKATGTIAIVKGPTSTQKDKDGNDVSAYVVAQRIAEALSRNETVFMPQYLFDDQTLSDIGRGGIDASKFTAWDIDTVDVGDTAAHASSIVEKLNYIDKELFMAWCRPAQEAMETNFGTKAQAGSHRDVGMLDSQLIHAQIVEQINAGPVRTMNIANGGPDNADKYIFEAAPLEDTSAALRDELIKQLTSGPESGKTMVHLDVRRMLKDAELPMVPEKDAEQALAEVEAKKQQEADADREHQMQLLKAKTQPGSNGRLAGAEN